MLINLDKSINPFQKPLDSTIRQIVYKQKAFKTNPARKWPCSKGLQENNKRGN